MNIKITNRATVVATLLIAAGVAFAQTSSTADAKTNAAPAICCGVGNSRIMAMMGASDSIASAVATSASAETKDDTTSATPATQSADRGTTPPGMVWIPGGQFTQGTADSAMWPAERPAHEVKVNGFWMDKTEVTNEEFAKFVAATGYLTTAETTPTLEEIMAQVAPGTPPPPPEVLVPGGLVFTPPDHPVQLNNEAQWWSWVLGADWKHPEGPDSNINGRENHPVVMVSWFDAQAYAKWAGKRLPTESEWERAARGGLEKKEFIWGDEFTPGGKIMANTWQGTFPNDNTVEDTFERTAPVASFPPNGYGLYDMGGNVWEWCSDWFQIDLYATLDTSKPQDNPQGPDKGSNPNHPFAQERTIRGGSFLCHRSYCSSYRPSARLGNTPDTGMSHVGIRTVKSPAK